MSTKPTQPLAHEIEYPIRLNRYLALKGLATRRGADELIAAGLVTLDGRVAKIGERVERADQRVVLGREARALHQSAVYYAYYKPRGIITHSPRGKEREIKAISGLRGVFPVGRLDKDSEGLIMLTNDGRITERLLSPHLAHEKEYVVTVAGILPPDLRIRLEAGIEESGERLVAKKVSLLGKHQATIILTEGKKHEIRRMLGTLGCSITSLKRIRIMGVHLGSLAPGEYRLLAGAARSKFLHDLGLEG